MANNYNVALRIGYNGQAVTQGAAKNARDLNRLQTATYQQGRASATAAGQNNLLSSSYRSMAGAVSLYALGAASIGFIKSASDAEMLQLRLDNLTTSGAQNAQVQRYLEEAAGRLHVRYSVLADSYTRLLVLERQQTITAEESRSILEGMTNVAKTLGASNVQVSQAMYGMTQAMTQGRVQAQELNQVIEPLPGLLQALDKAAGTSAGGFRQMVVDGKVTSQMFKQYLITALKDYEGAAQSAAGTLSASFSDFATEYDLLSKKLSAPINSAIVPLVNGATEALKLLGDNVDILDSLATGMIAVSAIYAGRLSGSIADVINKKRLEIAATNAQLIADKQLAASTMAKATTELHYAQQLQLAAQRQLAVAKNDYLRAAAIKNLAIANGQLTVAQNALTAATARYTAAATAATFATRAFNASLAFLGGPVGVAITAALAIGYFAHSANDASYETKELTGDVNDLIEKYKELDETGRRYQMLNYLSKEASLRNKLIASQKELNTLEDPARSITTKAMFGQGNAAEEAKQRKADQERIKTLKNDIVQLESDLNGIAERKAKLFNATLPENWLSLGGDGNQSTVDYSDDLQKLETYLGGAEAKVETSYQKRQAILDGAYTQGTLSQERYNELSTLLGLKKETELTEIARNETRKRLDDEERAQKERERRTQEHYDALIRQLYGYKDREAQVEAESMLRYNNEVRRKEVLEAQGYRDENHQAEVEHERRLLDIKLKNAGEFRNIVFGQKEWEVKTEQEKTQSVLSIGEFGFKQMAGQSKKAFAMYKAFSITKAIINTYEMATSSYAALAPINPLLGAAAAAAAIAYGLAQVNQIKNQQYSAAYHGGTDYVAQEQTALLTKGERIVSPRQNVALTAAVDRINKGTVGGGGNVINFNFAPSVVLQNGAESERQQAQGWLMEMYEKMKTDLINQLRTGSGAYYQAHREAVA